VFWWWWECSCFLSVRWCGEAFYWLGVQGVEVLIVLGALFLPSVAPASQHDFSFTGLMLSASVPYLPSSILPILLFLIFPLLLGGREFLRILSGECFLYLVLSDSS
jgi:hypothetical protein